MPRISQLPSLSASDNADEIAIVDVSASTTKKITRGDLLKAPLPANSVTTAAIQNGAVTTDTLADSAVTSSKLAPSKTTDANGWTVYDYGTWKQYKKLLGGSYSVTSGGGQSIGVQTAPSGVTLASSTHFIELSGFSATHREVYMSNADTTGASINIQLRNTTSSALSGTWAVTATVTNK